MLRCTWCMKTLPVIRAIYIKAMIANIIVSFQSSLSLDHSFINTNCNPILNYPLSQTCTIVKHL